MFLGRDHRFGCDHAVHLFEQTRIHQRLLNCSYVRAVITETQVPPQGLLGLQGDANNTVDLKNGVTRSDMVSRFDKNVRDRPSL